MVPIFGPARASIDRRTRPDAGRSPTRCAVAALPGERDPVRMATRVRHEQCTSYFGQPSDIRLGDAPVRGEAAAIRRHGSMAIPEVSRRCALIPPFVGAAIAAMLFAPVRHGHRRHSGSRKEAVACAPCRREAVLDPFLGGQARSSPSPNGRGVGERGGFRSESMRDAWLSSRTRPSSGASRHLLPSGEGAGLPSTSLDVDRIYSAPFRPIHASLPMIDPHEDPHEHLRSPRPRPARFPE